MVSVDKAIIARYEKGGHRFEMLVDPDLAWRYRRGEDVNFDELLASPDVYKDARKGDRASEELVQEVFGTTDPIEVAKYIIKHGEVHLTTEQRRKLYEEVRQKVATLIARRAVDPRTKTPHPVQRILNAMDQAKVHVDIFKKPEEQIEEVVSKIKRVLPIKMETRKIALRIPAQYASKAYSHVRAYKVIREAWGNDGSLSVVLEVPAGMVEEVLHDFAQITHGDLESRILE
jgi:ribosome maturation protein SDO1